MTSSADHHNFKRREILLLLERLHRHKDAAYGDAWRKRGEVIAIFANMARKYDRLLVAFDEERPAATEPLGDTVADLCVYTGKYLTWVADEHPADFTEARLPVESSAVSARRGADALETLLDTLSQDQSGPPDRVPTAWLMVRRSFDELERALMAQATPGAPPEQLMSYPEKASLAWRLAAELSWLLVLLDEEDPDALAKLRAEIADMDQAAPR